MTVNPQITDSITQVNTKVLGDAPAIAMGNLFAATSQALSNAAHNATAAQQQSMMIAQAATVAAVETLYSVDTASGGASTQEILNRKVAAVEEAMAPAKNVAIVAVPDVEADDFAYATRAAGDALAASLEALGEATCNNLLRVVQLAATTACLHAMIANPEQAASYESVLASIKRIV